MKTQKTPKQQFKNVSHIVSLSSILPHPRKHANFNTCFLSFTMQPPPLYRLHVHIFVFAYPGMIKAPRWYTHVILPLNYISSIFIKGTPSSLHGTLLLLKDNLIYDADSPNKDFSSVQMKSVWLNMAKGGCRFVGKAEKSVLQFNLVNSCECVDTASSIKWRRVSLITWPKI